MICIIDYGMGNLRSVEKAFLRLNASIILSSSSADIKKAQKLVLPGVGHFAKGMQHLKKMGLIEILNEEVQYHQKPILGICLGMQLMTEYSEEGQCEGLGWIKGTTRRFPPSSLKIPHMGWNNITVMQPHPLFQGISSIDRFYFVHSYYVSCASERNVLCLTEYGILFHSGIINQHIMGVQFHPEKSHQSGLRLLHNFIRI